jgi:hypothetical protein
VHYLEQEIIVRFVAEQGLATDLSNVVDAQEVWVKAPAIRIFFLIAVS